LLMVFWMRSVRHWPRPRLNSLLKKPDPESGVG
jgi:hypothetical protein